MAEANGMVLNVIYLSGFLDLFGVSLFLPLLSSYAMDLGASSTVIGMLGSLYGTLQFVAGPIVGKWSDVSGHRHALILCLILSAFGYLLLGFSYSLVIMFLARIPSGIFKHSQNISKAYITDITPKDHHSAVFGRFNAVSSFGFILGPPVGGHIAELPGGFQLAVTVTGGIFILNAGMLWYFVPEVKPGDLTTETMRQKNRVPAALNANNKEMKVRNNWTHSLAQFLKSFQNIDWRNLCDIFLIKLILGIGALLYRNQYTLFLKTRFNASPSTIGYMMSYSAIASACAGFMMGQIVKWYNNDTKLLHHATAMMFISLIMTAIVPNVFWMVVIGTPLALSTSICRVIITNLIIEKGHEHDSAALLGVGQSIMSIGRIVAPVLAGFSSEFSVVAPNLISASCSFIAFLMLVILQQISPKESRKID
ncbi:major facilitator superfamily domain-containing protein 9 [Lingula anatina]|uniref:Major facilitator superfamily domain-containing protein 9 n=1 Tax=Lingula anatina TaxID=7574 RepID=A0A1S3HPX7_LINAN|nr:major facilitator superfamily domain-containing protein 9 [Lingula anatina]|eukprot:XP_013388108.1 major facilitator superfamily domain-containing protein 9 [Lingula anatina]